MTPAQFLRAEHEEIIASWGERSRELAHVRSLPGLVLLDHLPALLEALAKRAEGTAAPLLVEASALDHAIHRCHYGVPLDEVLSEFVILRDVIAARYQDCSGHELPASFWQAFDDAVSETLELYKRAGIECERRGAARKGD